MRERGLKLELIRADCLQILVAPHAGAWIETELLLSKLVRDTSLPMRERGLKLADAGLSM